MTAWMLTPVSNHSNSLPFCSSRPGRPPKRAPVGLSLAASHLQHQQIKKHRLDNGDYPYENGHMGGKLTITILYHVCSRLLKILAVLKQKRNILSLKQDRLPFIYLFITSM